MGNKKVQLFIGILAIALIGVVLLALSGDDTEQQIPSHRSSDWSMNFSLASKDPNGLYLFEQLLLEEEKFPTFTVYPNEDYLDSICDTDSVLFMFIGGYLGLTTQEIDKVLNCVYRGSNFFFSTQYVPDYLLKRISDSVKITFYLQETASIKGNDETYDLISLYYGDTIPMAWQVIHPYRLKSKDVDWETLLSLNEAGIFYKISYGEGAFYSYLAPKAFYNYQLTREEGFNHFLAVTKHLPSAHIHWIDFANYEGNRYEKADEGRPEDSLLSKIFEYPSLTWAFIVLLIGMFLFFILNSRRTQPVVPVYRKNENQGYNYAETIGDIYMANNNPFAMIEIIRKNFYTTILNHFYVDISKGYSARQLSLLVEKSGLTKDRWEKVIKAVETKVCNSNEELMQLHTTLRAFYADAGCWNETVRKLDESLFVTINRSVGQAIGFLILGGAFIVLSFILLAFSIAWGILLWPLAIITLFLASRIYGHPVVKYNKEEMQFFALFGEAQTFARKDLTKIERNADELHFYFGNYHTEIIQLRNVDVRHHHLLLALKYELNKPKYGNTSE